MKYRHTVCKVEKNSIAAEMEIEPGDVLLTVNGNEMMDVFDYHFLINNEYIELLIEKPDGEQWELEIEKEEEDGLGIEFEQSLMDEYKSCRNQCIFCFIDQMPKGMRETLYFKDDDSRLSFLQGNYITLTNMTDQDIRRIVQYRLEPVNISIHTTNPELRCQMLRNRFAGEALQRINLLYQGEIKMNGQIVLCKGVNDGAELVRSIEDLSNFFPYLQSVSIVPVGMTKYREGLYPLQTFSKADAKAVLQLIHQWQDKMYQEHGSHFVHAGDEWYLLAGEEVPAKERYDDYLQLENGVGMLRLLLDEVKEELISLAVDSRSREISLVTGELAAPYIAKIVADVQEKYPNIKVYMYPIRNNFFGAQITVSGLITGKDILAQLVGKPLGEVLLIPENMLRNEGDVFLDDITVNQMEKTLQVRVDIVKSSGQDFIAAISGGI